MNVGKGMGMKVPDALLMSLCCDEPGQVGCHTIIDQTIGMTRDERRELEYRLVVKTYQMLIEAKALVLSPRWRLEL